jgi:hypothetical protein
MTAATNAAAAAQPGSRGHSTWSSIETPAAKAIAVVIKRGRPSVRSASKDAICGTISRSKIRANCRSGSWERACEERSAAAMAIFLAGEVGRRHDATRISTNG